MFIKYMYYSADLKEWLGVRCDSRGLVLDDRPRPLDLPAGLTLIEFYNNYLYK